MMRKLALLSAILILGLILAQYVHAQPPDPAATAQAAQTEAENARWRASQAQRQANQAAAAAGAAQATADAAWSQATATAQWIATATPAAATQQAQATQDALEVWATRQALNLEATRAAQELSAAATATSQTQMATATKAAAIAEQDRIIAEMDRLTIEREKTLQPIYRWGPWLLVALIGSAVGLLVRQLARGRSTGGVIPPLPPDIIIECGQGDPAPPETQCTTPALLPPPSPASKPRETRAVLRPLKKRE
jgi:hypothetical protein